MQQSATPLFGSRQIQTLIVEPETEARQLLELALSVRGQTVTACSDAAAARAALRDTAFAIIVISRFLPDSDALQIVREVRGAESGSGSVPATIVVISSIPTPEDQAELIDAGADDYVPWPAGTDLLRERFDNAERQAATRMAAATPVSRNTPSSELFLVLRPDATILRAGRSAEHVLGYPSDALTGVNAFSFFDPADAARILSLIVEAFTQPEGAKPREVRVRRDNDVWRTVSLSATNATDDPTIGGLALYLHTPSARLDDADTATRAALHDAVTDLPNRTLFLDRIDHAVARAARKALPVVVVTVDFNGFTGAGDISDGLFVALAQRLRSCLRTSDTAARLGPDEFGMLLEDIVDLENVRIVAERVVESMIVPFYESGAEIQLTPNIGIVVSSTERYRAIDLLRDSETARTWARVQGSGRYVMFDESMALTGEIDEDTTPTTSAPVAAVPPTTAAPTVTPMAATPAAVDARFDALQDRLDTLEQLIRGLDRS